MNRFHGLILAVLATAAISACASAPADTGVAVPTPEVDESNFPPGLARPSDNEFTTRAALLVAQAQSTDEEARRQQLGEQAVQAAQEGLQRDTLNPKLWLLLGQAEALTNEFEAADAAFERALEIYPAYQPQIEAEREAAWVQAFRAGAQAMETETENRDEAIRFFEQAQMIYDRRPEALMNLASLYVASDQPDKAIAAYQRVIEIVSAPTSEQFSPEMTADWPGFAETARLNIPRLYVSAGVEDFRAERYEQSARAFQRALEFNPYSHDALSLLTQTYYVMTSDIEERLEAAPDAEKAEIRSQLRELYPRFVEVAERYREVDAYNQNTLALLARAYRGMGVLAGQQAEGDEWRNKALRVLQEAQALPVQITNVQVSLGDSAVTLNGNVENKTLDAGQNVTVRITMLNADGESVGTAQTRVAVGAANAATPFSVTVPVTGQALGWRFDVETAGASP